METFDLTRLVLWELKSTTTRLQLFPIILHVPSSANDLFNYNLPLLNEAFKRLPEATISCPHIDAMEDSTKHFNKIENTAIY